MFAIALGTVMLLASTASAAPGGASDKSTPNRPPTVVKSLDHPSNSNHKDKEKGKGKGQETTTTTTLPQSTTSATLPPDASTPTTPASTTTTAPDATPTVPDTETTTPPPATTAPTGGTTTTTSTTPESTTTSVAKPATTEAVPGVDDGADGDGGEPAPTSVPSDALLSGGDDGGVIAFFTVGLEDVDDQQWMKTAVAPWAWSDPALFELSAPLPVEVFRAVGRAIVTAGAGLAAPASATLTLILLAVISRRRSTIGAIPSGS